MMHTFGKSLILRPSAAAGGCGLGDHAAGCIGICQRRSAGDVRRHTARYTGAMDEIDTTRLSESPPDITALMMQTPFSKALGMSLVRIDKARATLSVPYQDKLIGNPVTRMIHGGVVTALLDHTSGFAVFMALDKLVSIATLDLRIDYMRAAEPGRTIFADAHCFKVTASIAFVRGMAYHDTPDNPIATMTAAFMLSSDESRKLGAAAK
jgi:uncharacterized protein (TIGR00369 family)